MENRITTLLKKPDNIEMIRDTISAILKVECFSQYAIAKELQESDMEEYRIGVWKEKSRPWQLTEDNERKNPFPLVNINLIGFHEDNPGGPAIGQKKYVGEFFLDCYARGEYTAAEADDTDSALKAWKVGRIIRNILTSEHYAYLGIRGIVRDYKITEGKTGDPRNNDNSAQSVTICRLVLSVNYYEDSPQVDGPELKEMSFVSSSPSGEVLINL